MINAYTLELPNYIVYIAIGVVVLFFIFLEILKSIKDRKTVIANIVSQLINHSFTNVKHTKEDITCSYGKKRFVIHIETFGRRYSLLMTNAKTIFKRQQSKHYKPAKRSKRLDSLVPFLSLKEEKILFIQNNLVKKEKYINENEMEEINCFVKSFNTYIVNEGELKEFLDHLIETLSLKK
jgi:hypothetical protein